MGSEADRLLAAATRGRRARKAEHPDSGGRRHTNGPRGRPAEPHGLKGSPFRDLPDHVRGKLHHAAQEGAPVFRRPASLQLPDAGRPEGVNVGICQPHEHGGTRPAQFGRPHRAGSGDAGKAATALFVEGGPAHSSKNVRVTGSWLIENFTFLRDSAGTSNGFPSNR